ncbi:MAG: YebC/PmpR family DNA-binding transcriptional regulator [Clostridia bacterium]|nr:YebC/PmpR family DNA-binding transcriptional regulator [Clostridia bacterium]
MSGHSKWKNIQHKKEKTDAQRASVFTKIGKEMAIAIKAAGPDPVSNTKLRDLIAKAKSLNVPNDNIDRIIKKFSSNDAANYEEIVYEGYGPSGVAVIVVAATDNRNRTAGDVRHYFDKYGGNLGQNGCVSYMFTDAGTIIIDGENVADEDKLMEDALEAGASDIIADDGIFEIRTEPDDLSAVKEALEGMGYKIESAEPDKIPSTYVTLESEDDLKKMNLLLEKLDEHDDVQNVYHNWENEE